ncbi:MAG: S8 family peptidase [Proteobacteria bacterium]|nr:S8 family peptidase [Pseudomonadota bacterium]
MKRYLYGIVYISIIIFLAGQTAYAFMIHGQNCVPDEILVKFKRGTAEDTQVRILQELGALSIKPSYKNRFKVVKIPEGMLENMLSRFSRHPAVAYAVPNYSLKLYFTPDDKYYDLQWNFPLIHVDQAWDKSSGEGVTVAVVDTGVNPTGHDGFGNRLLQGYDAILGIQGYWQDNNSHGTHVAGTIAQETNNGTGVAGIAYRAKILPVKVLPRSGFASDSNISWVTDGIDWAVENGADIINMSLGGPNSPLLEEAVNDAVNQGVTVIAAAGNHNYNENTQVGYPAAYDSVIAVGAVDYNKQRATYSNYGPELDIVAPGGDTSQDANGDGYMDGIVQETFRQYLGFRYFAVDWNYYFFQGTSMAAPHVAGVAALIKSKHPDWTPEQIRSALLNTAEDLGDPGRDDQYGYGLVDAFAAVTY